MSILHLSDEQLEQVFRAMRPLPVRDRHAFLQAVADGLRGKTIGDGEVSALSVTRSADSKRRPTLISRPSVDWVSASTPEPRHELSARAQLAPNHERLALHCLKRVAGFEIYAPRIRAPCIARYQDPRPLFPGYVSCSSFCSGMPPKGRPADISR